MKKIFNLLLLLFVINNTQSQSDLHHENQNEEVPPPTMPITLPPFDSKKVIMYPFDSTNFGQADFIVLNSTNEPITGIIYKNRSDGNIWYEYHCDRGQLFYMKQYHYSNEKIFREYSFKDGKQHGIFREWQPNGQVVIKGYHKHGELHGKLQNFSLNGRLLKETNYIDGKVVGWRRAWSESGELLGEGNIIEGNGEYIERYEKSMGGGIRTKVSYENGEIHGLQKVWDLKGILIEETNYSEGDFLERVRWQWYDNGQLYQESKRYGGMTGDETKCWNRDGQEIECP